MQRQPCTSSLINIITTTPGHIKRIHDEDQLDIMNNCITPEPTETVAMLSAPLSPSSIQDEQLPIQPRKRPLFDQVCCEPNHNDDSKKSSSSNRPIFSDATSCSRKRQRTKKEPTAVRFASAPHQTHVVPRWTDDEAASSWYSKHDILTFKYQESLDAAVLRALIQTASTINRLPQESAVYRGLERLLSTQIASEILDRRNRCVMGVLLAQHNGLSTDLIAQVSKNFTDEAAAWALTLGSV